MIISIMNYYVYVYRDPENKKIFYVGKGKGERAFSHLKKREKGIPLHNRDLELKIDDYLKIGKKPIIEIIAHFDDETRALEAENKTIKEIGIENLSNKIDSLWPPIMPADVIAKRANTCKNNLKWRETMTSTAHREKLSKSVKQAIKDRGGRPPLSAEHRVAVSLGVKGKLSGLKNPMSKNTPTQIFNYLKAVMDGGHWKKTAKEMGISNAWNVVQRKAWQSVEPPTGYSPPPSKKVLNEEIKNKILELHSSHVSTSEISKIIGFSTTTVRNVISCKN